MPEITKDNPKIKDTHPESPLDKNADLLDVLETKVLFKREIEEQWECRPNQLLERHPYLIGYAFMAVVVYALFATHLVTFAVSFMFLYLVSDFLTNDLRRIFKFVPKGLLFSILYVVLLGLLAVLIFNVIPAFLKQLPGLAKQLEVQAITQFEIANQRWDISRYVDPNEVRAGIVSATTTTLRILGKNITTFSKGFVYFVFALIVNLLLYHNIEKLDNVFARKPAGMLNFIYRFIMTRIRVFYFYFKRVMGGQIIISAVNTAISTIAIIALGLPHPVLLIFVVFVFGLFPVVGNIASNTVLTVTAFISMGTIGALICLGLLVGIHKLEYFLNSKIIGEIVNLPMVVTLTALIVAEVLMGIPGLILAIPLLLFFRHEMELIPGLNEIPLARKPALKKTSPPQ